MNNRIRQLLPPLAALAALALAPAAVASPDAVVRDCAKDGSLDGSYSDADKRAALGRLPADLDEYSDCRAMIGASIGGRPKAAADRASRGDPGGAGGKGATAQRDAVRRASEAREARRERARKARELALGDRAVDPRNAGVFKSANTANGIPLPVLLALGALALLVLAGGLLSLRRRSPAFAGALRRVTPPRLRR